MSGTGRLLCSFTRSSLSRGIFNYGTATSLRPKNVRALALTDHMWTRSTKPAAGGDDDGGEGLNKPIKFSTSKASHRTWNVERSMGSQYQRPWWKVLPVSLLTLSFILWCMFRGQTDIDKLLEKELYEHLPGLLSDEEEEGEREEAGDVVPVASKSS